MPDTKDKKPEHSKLADIERLRQIRYMTKDAGAAKARPALARPTVDQLRSKVAKVAKKKAKKRSRR